MEPSGCWIWTACLGNKSYGLFKLDGKHQRAHRLSYQCFKGEIPDEMLVCHTCDNPTCVNPAHLWVGTNDDNMNDKVKKGRQSRLHGETNGFSKLTEDDVKAIRADKRLQRQIAADYGIHQANVSLIKLRKSWSHVDD